MSSRLLIDRVPLHHQIHSDLANGRTERAFDRLIDRLDGAAGLQDKYAALQLLPYIAEQLPGAAVTESRRQQAKQHGLKLRHLRSFVGRVEFPAVAAAESRFVAVSVSYSEDDDDDLPLDLDFETRDAITHALTAARRIGKVTRSLRVSLERTQLKIQGRSLGLAVGVATLSLLLEREVPEHLVFTGELLSDGEIQPITQLPDKLQLLRDARPLAVLFVPSAQCIGEDLHVHPATTLWGVADRVGLLRESDLDRSMGELLADFQCGAWRKAAHSARQLLAESGLRADEKMRLHTILLSAANHCGHIQEAAEQEACLAQLQVESCLSVTAIAHALANRAVRRIDLLRGQEAEDLLGQANALSLGDDHPSWIHIRGTHARAKILQGDPESALRMRQQNVERCSEEEERPRCLGDLADSYLRLGRFSEAGEALGEAHDALQKQRRRRIGYRELTAQHLLLHRVRLCHALGQKDLARRLLLADPKPRHQRIELLQIEEVLHREAPTADSVDKLFDSFPLRHSPIFRALYFRAKIMLGDHSVLDELRSILHMPGQDAAELCLRIPY